MTGEAVRQQLIQLQREGWVEIQGGRDDEAARKASQRDDRASGRAARTGRPASRFRLTGAGEHLFPKSYDTLALKVLGTIDHHLGAGALEKVYANMSSDRVRDLEAIMKELDLARRVEVLQAYYAADDAFMEIEPARNGFRLVERNCPYLNVAMEQPGVCSVSVNAMTRLLGVRVVREESFQRGDGRCVFRVRSDEPVDGRRLGFRFEG